jgi:hypothetical protein
MWKRHNQVNDIQNCYFCEHAKNCDFNELCNKNKSIYDKFMWVDGRWMDDVRL